MKQAAIFDLDGVIGDTARFHYLAWKRLAAELGFQFTEAQNEPSMALLKKLGYKDMGFIPSRESRVFGKWITSATEAEIAQATNSAK